MDSLVFNRDAQQAPNGSTGKAPGSKEAHLPGKFGSDDYQLLIVAEKTGGGGNLLDQAIAENVKRQVARLKDSPPIVKKFYGEKKIGIAGGVYDIATGKVTMV